MDLWHVCQRQSRAFYLSQHFVELDNVVHGMILYESEIARVDVDHLCASRISDSVVRLHEHINLSARYVPCVEEVGQPSHGCRHPGSHEGLLVPQ